MVWLIYDKLMSIIVIFVLIFNFFYIEINNEYKD